MRFSELVIPTRKAGSRNCERTEDSGAAFPCSSGKGINSRHRQGKFLLFSTPKNLPNVLQTLIRIGLGLEAHCLWIPTAMYYEIVNAPLQLRGKKSHAYGIPSHLFDGPPGMNGQISIQLAFIRPDWTLIFADHNVMISFHIMQLRRPCTPSDLRPGSKVCL